MTMLGLVVAAGLVMGLITFRMTGGSAPVATAAVGNSAVGNADAPRPSAADSVVDVQPEAPPQTTEADSQNGEPSTAKDLPEIQGPGSGDPPGTAVDPSAPPADVAAPPPADVPPQ